jgi:glycosyltransferase involved in cell wall biosynthesis
MRRSAVWLRIERGRGCNGRERDSGVNEEPVEIAPLVLSLIIPAYDEARRIAQTLADAHAYLADRPFPTELILVDDGSDDETAAIAQAFTASHPNTRVLSILHGGKAAAVRAGMLAASGAQIAFCDADLATPLTYLADLQRALDRGCDLAIGSREGIGAQRIGEPSYRHVMGRVFNGLVRLLVLPGIQDTQCGFKLFRREVARAILDRARLYAEPGARISGPRVTAFDVELLVIARRLGYQICAIPVIWSYGEQTKVNPARDTWHNFVEVLRVRLNDWRGLYR